MTKHVLSVSYNQSLLLTRQLLLEKQGYRVTSALGFPAAVAQCSNGEFDLFVLGHSIPKKDKLALVETFRSHCPAPIVSLVNQTEEPIESDFEADPYRPQEFVQLVSDIFKI